MISSIPFLLSIRPIRPSRPVGHFRFIHPTISLLNLLLILVDVISEPLASPTCSPLPRPLQISLIFRLLAPSMYAAYSTFLADLDTLLSIRIRLFLLLVFLPRFTILSSRPLHCLSLLQYLLLFGIHFDGQNCISLLLFRHRSLLLHIFKS